MEKDKNNKILEIFNHNFGQEFKTEKEANEFLENITKNKQLNIIGYRIIS